MRGQRGRDGSLGRHRVGARAQAHGVRLQGPAARAALEAVVVLGVAVVVVVGGLVVDSVAGRGGLQGVAAGRGADGGTWRAAGGGGLFAVVEVATMLRGVAGWVRVVEEVGVLARVAALADAVEREEGGGGEEERAEGDGDGDDCGGGELGGGGGGGGRAAGCVGGCSDVDGCGGEE